MGIGLRGLGSITIEEESLIRGSNNIYLDGYTSFLPPSFEEDFRRHFKKNFTRLERKGIEGDGIREIAGKEDLIIMVPGDPFVATTHRALINGIMEMGIEVDVIENSSIIPLLQYKSGLNFYRFGQVVSLPRTMDNFLPVSPLKKILMNMAGNLHTILLVDIWEGRNMPLKESAKAFMDMSLKENGGILEDQDMIVLSRLSWPEESVFTTNPMEMAGVKADLTPYSIIVPANIDHTETLPPRMEFSGEGNRNSLSMLQHKNE